MVKALIIYGTRYGATADTSKIIAEILREEGFDVRVVNAKNENIQSISEYDLLIVGSGIRMARWTKEPERFLKKFRKEIEQKKLAIFVCCGAAQPLSEGQEKSKEIEDARRKYLIEKAAKYNLKPISSGLFGGVYDFNKMHWFFRNTMSTVKDQLEEAGYKESEAGHYDTRDLDAIRDWAKKVSEKAKLSETQIRDQSD